MTDQEALSSQLQAMIDKSQRSLAAAKDHLSKGDYDFASSKAYYAVFHMMQAALLTKAKSYSKHAGVISGFSEHFVKLGIFSSKFGEAIQRLRKDRELGDYGYLMKVTTEEAQQDLKAAEEIVSAVSAYLQPFLSKKI